MNNLETIHLYEKIAETTGRMLSAANREDWDSLIELESQCAAHVRTLKMNNSPAFITGEGRQKKIDFIKKILADDQQIRAITQPRLAKLATILNSSRIERNLQKSYVANRTGF